MVIGISILIGISIVIEIFYKVWLKVAPNKGTINDLREVLTISKKYHMRLNPKKCIFFMEFGEFLEFPLTEREWWQTQIRSKQFEPWKYRHG